MKRFVFSILLLALSLGQARAESLLSSEERDLLPGRTTLAEGDRLVFPKGFQLEKFNPALGYAATVISGRNDHGREFACTLTIPAVSEVKFAQKLDWQVLSATDIGGVQRYTLATGQWGSDRELEFRCTKGADAGEVLGGMGVKLLALVPVETVDQTP
ncbi:MAG: hypothetical protein ACXVB9_11950 [Bdellovibrionota bacterium]